jgi:hypothetical protein
MTSLTYDRVEQAMKEAVPEVEQHYPGLVSWHPEPGLYTLFDCALRPVFTPALDSGMDTSLLKRIFDFFEEMACSSDIQVVNLLQVEIFERLVREPNRLATAWKFMGPQTKKIARDTARIWRCEENLPEE